MLWDRKLIREANLSSLKLCSNSNNKEKLSKCKMITLRGKYKKSKITNRNLLSLMMTNKKRLNGIIKILSIQKWTKISMKSQNLSINRKFSIKLKLIVKDRLKVSVKMPLRILMNRCVSKLMRKRNLRCLRNRFIRLIEITLGG